MAKKSLRIVFYQYARTPTPAVYRMASVAVATAATTPVVVYESSDNQFFLTGLVFSPDEGRFAYSVYYAYSAAPPVFGLRSASTSANDRVVVEPTTAYNYPSCVSFNAAGTRLAYVYGPNLRTSSATAATATTYVPAGSQYTCPAFTSDDRVWLQYADGAGNRFVALAPADASAAPTPFLSNADLKGATFSPAGALYSVGPAVPYFKPLSGAAVLVDSTSDTTPAWLNASGTRAFYRKLELPYVTVAYGSTSLYTVDLTAATPVGAWVTDDYYTHLVSPDDESKAVAYTRAEKPGAFYTAVSFDTATGASKALLRRVSSVALQRVGATPALKVIAFRKDSPTPYDFQDGVYVADP
jgi:hypothetical protein